MTNALRTTLLAAALSCHPVLAFTPSVVAGPEPADPEAALEERCTNPESAECAAAGALLEDLMLGDLRILERSRDRRAIDVARELIDSDEPELQAGALRILGRFMGSDGQAYVKEIAPLVLSASPRNQRLAALALVRSGEPAARAIGAQYIRNHPSQADPTDDDDDSAPDVTVPNLPPYPGARRYPPGDSMRSVGLATDATVDEVVGLYRNEAEPLAWPAFVAAVVGSPQPAEDAELAVAYERKEQAGREWDVAFASGKPPDAAITKRLDAAQQELTRQRAARAVAWVSGLPATLSASDDRVVAEEPLQSARFLILKRQGDHPSKMVAVYRDPLLDLTVIHLMWNPGLVQSAAAQAPPAMLLSPSPLENYQDTVRRGDALVAAGDYFEAVRVYESAGRIVYNNQLKVDAKVLEDRLAKARAGREGAAPAAPTPAAATATPPATPAPGGAAATPAPAAPLEQYQQRLRDGDALVAAGDYFEAVRVYESAGRIVYNNQLKVDAKVLEDRLAKARGARDQAAYDERVRMGDAHMAAGEPTKAVLAYEDAARIAKGYSLLVDAKALEQKLEKARSENGAEQRR